MSTDKYSQKQDEHQEEYEVTTRGKIIVITMPRQASTHYLNPAFISDIMEYPSIDKIYITIAGDEENSLVFKGMDAQSKQTIIDAFCLGVK